ncbi:hypothetical protein GCM10009128_09920 [Psychrosphaera haliotis]
MLINIRYFRTKSIKFPKTGQRTFKNGQSLDHSIVPAYKVIKIFPKKKKLRIIEVSFSNLAF